MTGWSPPHRLGHLLLASAVLGAALAGTAAPSAASTRGLRTRAQAAPVASPASLVNPLIGTSGGGNEFPGPDMPGRNAIGVSSDGQDAPEGYDGSGYTYSADALAADGITPGASLTVDGVSYTWPDEPPGRLDSIWSAGQVIPVRFPAGTTRIGLLGSAIDAGRGGATGTLTVSYTDGSTQQIPVTFGDWTLGAGAYPVPAGDTVAATSPYRDLTSGISQPVRTYIYATSATLEAGKTVSSINLPSGSGGDIGIFAIGAG